MTTRVVGSWLVASTQPLHFVLPESHASVSGGNVYNAALLRSLEQRHGVRRQSIADFRITAPGPGNYLIDSLNLADFRAMQLAREKGRHFILLVHHLPSLEPGLPADDPSLALEAATLDLFDGFLCTSEFTAHYLRSRGYAQPSITLEPVIESPQLVPRPPGQSVHALMSCNLIRRKGILAFLQALAEATRPADCYRIDIVGRHDLEAPYSEACRRCIDASAELSSRVHLQGEAPNEAMATWYLEANLFVSSSGMETYGISLQEARHFGLPMLVVAGGNSGNHVIPGVTGAVYADPSELAAGFVDLAGQPALFDSYLREAQEQRPTRGGNWQESADALMQHLEACFPCR